jgi:hypothetical protein
VVGDDEAEDGVAEELESLVGRRARRLRAPGSVRDRPGQQVAVVELTAQSPAERIELGAQLRQPTPSFAAT